MRSFCGIPFPVNYQLSEMLRRGNRDQHSKQKPTLFSMGFYSMFGSKMKLLSHSEFCGIVVYQNRIVTGYQSETVPVGRVRPCKNFLMVILRPVKLFVL